MSSPPLLELCAVSKSFGPHKAVDDVSLMLEAGSFFALLGPSGCGKSTIMRMIAGFERPDSGAILLDGEDLAALPPHQRPVNMMFQSYALFPHLTIAANIGFGLEMAGLPRKAILTKVEQLLALMHLEGLGGRRPDQLSGGQRQRVALARALAREPRLLLLDEPLGALDKRLREEMQIELKNLQQQLGLAFLVVTHDQDEALSLADQMAVMGKGRIAQTGTPLDIYEQPQTLEIARFIGEFNILTSPLPGTPACGPGEILGWRPEKARLNGEGLALTGQIEAISYRGDRTLLQLSSPHGPFVLPVTREDCTHNAIAMGASLTCFIPPQAFIRVRP